MLFLFTQTLLASTLTFGSHTVNHVELDNGLDLLWIDDGVARIDLYTAYAAGSYMDSKPELAHMTEHAMFCTKEGAFDEILKPYVEETNAYTRAEHTTYFTTAVSLDDFPLVIEREFRRMKQLEVDQACFEYELGRLNKEVDGNHTLLADWDLDRRELLFHRSYAGRPASTDQLTIDDVKQFYSDWYQPNRAALVVVGSIGEENWQQLMDKFGALPNRSDVEIEMSAPAATNSTLEYALSKERLEWVWRGPTIEQETEWLYWTLLTKAHELQRGSSGLGLSFSGGMQASFIEVSVSGEDNEQQITDLYQKIQGGDIDEALFAEAKKSFSNHLGGLPIRGRPYFTLASDLAYWASWDKLETLNSMIEQGVVAAAQVPSSAALAYVNPSDRIVIDYPKGNVGELPTDAKALGEAAQLAQNSGDLSRAIACYNKLLELKPGKINSVIYHYYLAHLHLESGDKVRAKSHLQQGLDIVEYPALREMLNEIDSFVPHGRDESYVPTGDVKITFEGEPPEWLEQALETMVRIERWRGLKFTENVTVHFQEDAGYNASGWYDYETKRLVVGKEGSQRYIEGVMLHELYHALQDQHFDLGKLNKQMKNDDQRAAMQAVIEGEAMLAVAELMNYDFLSHVNYTKDLTEEQFTTMFNYGEGMKFVKSIRNDGGWEAVNQLYSSPPVGSASIIDPSKYGAQPSVETTKKRRNGLKRGEKMLDLRAEGGIAWMFFLVQNAPDLIETLAPLYVEDQYIVYKRKKQIRHRWRIGFASPEVAQDVASQLQNQVTEATVDGRWLVIEIPR